MRAKSIMQTAAALTGVGVLLIGTLLLCNGAIRLRDADMLSKAYPREALPNTVLPQAEKIPIVAALWDLETFYDKDTLFRETGKPERAVSDATKQQIADILTRLKQAGALPQAVFEAVMVPLDTAQPAGVLIKTETEFSQLYGGNYDLQLYNNTLATNAGFWSEHAFNAEIDLPACLNGYIAYLGMDTLNDWKSAPTADIEGQQAVALYSKAAQMYVMALLDTRYSTSTAFSVGAYPMPYAALEQRVGTAG